MKTVDDYIVTSKPMSLFSYWAAYVALMILLVATYSLSRWLPPSIHVGVSLLISVLKALLVLWFFMHLRSSSKTVLLFFLASLFTLWIGFVLSFSDYFTR